jgi:hypothetical protein
VDVVDDAPLFLQSVLDWLAIHGCFIGPLTKFVVGLLKAVPTAAVVATTSPMRKPGEGNKARFEKAK